MNNSFFGKIIESAAGLAPMVGKAYARGGWVERGFDWEGAIEYARTVGVRLLGRMSLAERADMLIKIAEVITAHRKELIALATKFGKTESDAKADLNGAILSYRYYGELGKQMADGSLKKGTRCVEIQGNRKYVGVTVQIVDGEIRVLEDAGVAMLHLAQGNIAVLIDAFNFFYWGAHHKAAAALLAGTPVISKPATVTSLASQRLMEILVEEAGLPEGAFQFVPGRIDADVYRYLKEGDVVAFTGSGTVAELLRSNPLITPRGIRLNIERDSVNAIALGDDVEPDTPVYRAFIDHAAREIFEVNKGERCTKPGRIVCRQSLRERVRDDIVALLRLYRVGDPTLPGVHIGPLTTDEQVRAAREGISTFQRSGARIVFGNPDASVSPESWFEGNPIEGRSFVGPVLFEFDGDALSIPVFHERELFGPFAILLDDGGKGIAQTVEIVNAGGPKLVTAIYTNSPEVARTFVIGTAPHHGRVLVVDEIALAETTVGSFGPGTPWPELLHGIPGEGVELGGLRGLTLFTGDEIVPGSDVQGARKFLRKVIPGQGF